MAEARLAVAFRFQVNDDGHLEVNLDRSLFAHVLFSIVHSARSRISRARRVVLRTIYPGSVWTLLALLISVCCTQYLAPDLAFLASWQEYIPFLSYLPAGGQGPVAALLLGFLVWTVCALIQRYSLLLALSYKGFLFVPHGRTPLSIRAWFILVRLLEGPMKASTYMYQSALPYLPLPSVKSTCSRYLKSVRPLVSAERFREIEKITAEFQAGLGIKIQCYLWLWWFCSKNYVSEWWLKYVYLRGRSPIMVNSNYYILDTYIKNTNIAAARAGTIINAMAKFKRKIDNEQLDPILIQDTVPLCMDQYSRTFGTTRVPGLDQDNIAHVPPSQSQHVVVMRNGRFYEVPLMWNGRLLTPPELEQRFQSIMDDDKDDSETPESHRLLPAMTGVNRTQWATFRDTHILRNATNRHTLMRIDAAAVVLVFEDGEPELDDAESLTKFGCSAIHGTGCSRWFDKSLVFTIYSNARFHLTAEHAWADAPVCAHVLEAIFTTEHMSRLAKTDYNSDGHCRGSVTAPMRRPTRLQWQFNDDACREVSVCHGEALKIIDDFDLFILEHEAFGKGEIKKCRVSPDAFIQMALQLAYYRDVDYFSLTYEASMTRLYRFGRTETVRPVSSESCAFVRAMCDPSVPDEQRRALFRAAASTHQDNYRNAMAGNGVDRHLFTMYVVSQYLKAKSPFLDAVFGEPWRLSTSQTPQTQTHIGAKLVRAPGLDVLRSPGGGFGPVADDGYGVSYIISAENRIYFHVSSKHSASVTNSRRFAANIERAMGEMLKLLVTASASTKKSK